MRTQIRRSHQSRPTIEHVRHLIFMPASCFRCWPKNNDEPLIARYVSRRFSVAIKAQRTSTKDTVFDIFHAAIVYMTKTNADAIEGTPNPLIIMPSYERQMSNHTYKTGPLCPLTLQI